MSNNGIKSLLPMGYKANSSLSANTILDDLFFDQLRWQYVFQQFFIYYSNV